MVLLIDRPHYMGPSLHVQKEKGCGTTNLVLLYPTFFQSQQCVAYGAGSLQGG